MVDEIKKPKQEEEMKEEKPEEKEVVETEKEEKEEKQKKKSGKEKKEIKPKEKAIVRGVSLRLSFKHCVAICKIIKNKKPEKAIEMLKEVVLGKRPVPMPQLEVAHQKGKGIAGAKFPGKASGEIIKLIEQLKANSIVNQIENPIIVIAKADKASRPFKKGGRKAKRCHVLLEAVAKSKLVKNKGGKK